MMKTIWICFLTFIFVFTSAPLLARGGRGGGGGGGRTPSMSRAALSPAQRSEARPSSQANRRVMSQNSPKISKPVQQSTARNVERTPSMSNIQNRPAVKSQVNTRDAVSQYRNQKPFQGDISKVPQARQDNVRAALPKKFQAQKQTASRLGDNVRKNHPNHGDWFTPEFNHRHDFTPNFDMQKSARRRWGWNHINSWLNYGWSYPYYYDYGYPVELASGFETYYQGLNDVPIEEQWILLGVFAIGKDEANAAYSNMFLQIALDKQGNLAGTYYNATTDQMMGIEGYVDQKTQGAFWRISGKQDSPLMSTGIFNLTQDIVPITLIFSSSTEQNWVMIRANE